MTMQSASQQEIVVIGEALIDIIERRGISPIEAQILRAAAHAHNESGAPICTHTTLGTLGKEQLGLFKAMGVDLSHVVLSHIDLAEDFDYVLELLDSGVNIGFDTVGKNNYQPDERRAAWLLALCQRGYSGRIVLSMDITRASNVASPGYAYLINSFLPRLRALGLKEEWISAMTGGNARRIYRIEEAAQ